MIRSSSIRSFIFNYGTSENNEMGGRKLFLRRRTSYNCTSAAACSSPLALPPAPAACAREAIKRALNLLAPGSSCLIGPRSSVVCVPLALH